jgi:hypothetical protein
MQTVWAQFLKLEVPPQLEEYRSQLLQKQQLKQLRERLAKL